MSTAVHGQAASGALPAPMTSTSTFLCVDAIASVVVSSACAAERLSPLSCRASRRPVRASFRSECGMSELAFLFLTLASLPLMEAQGGRFCE